MSRGFSFQIFRGESLVLWDEGMLPWQGDVTVSRFFGWARNVGVLIITHTVFLFFLGGVPYYNYSFIGPRTLF